jgi:hypothetical protein
MYGNTRAVAEAVASGLSPAYETEIKPAAEATADGVGRADLLVVGGPTHVHGLARPSTRKAAAEAVATHDELTLDRSAQGTGLREWFEQLGRGDGKKAAAFDTRLSASPLFTGRASVRIAKHLRKSAFEAADEPESFLVDKTNHLLDGELERARDWGRRLAG